MPKDALSRRRGRRPAGFCQEQTLVLTEQFSSVECDAFHVSYMSDKIPEAAFHSQAAKTVAYLRVSIAYQDVRSQRLAILKYVRKHGFRIDDFIEATASGQVPEKRQRLDGLINVLQRGDRLVVSEPLPARPVAGSDRRHPRRPRQGQVLGPEVRAPERFVGRLTAQRQGGRHPALPRGFEVRRVDRAKKIVELHRAGLSLRQIAVVVGCHYSSDSRVLRQPMAIAIDSLTDG